jgi:hypothetical protein
MCCCFIKMNAIVVVFILNENGSVVYDLRSIKNCFALNCEMM